MEALFGPGYRLNRVKDLSQPGQFACAERVSLEGPKGILQNVVVLGPERPESQVEISLTDGVALGIIAAGAPVWRHGGHAGRSPCATGTGWCGWTTASSPPGGTCTSPPPRPPASGWRTASRCACGASPPAPLVLEDVEVRVSPNFSAAAHIDYDEANACGFQKGDRGLILI